MKNTSLEYTPTASLRPYSRNARTHSKKQIRQIARSIEKFGFNNPVLISDDREIIAGHGRVAAAELLGMEIVPTIRLSHLSDADRKAYVLADNKLALNAGWDQDILAIELQAIIDTEIDVDFTGFEMPEIDIILDAAAARQPHALKDLDDDIPAPPLNPVTRAGDIWFMGRHRLICGNALHPPVCGLLLDGESVDLIFTDPPYNVPIAGNVSGLGKHRHREFAFASGEMNRVEFTAFLATALGIAAANARDGAIAFVCMDWRHMHELQVAGELAFDDLKNVCVWNKTNAGMGTFYRSKHEMVFVFKIGKAPHINNFGLGDKGRYRTNVWDYTGISSLSATRDTELAMHPTVKPVKLVLDAIEDCSQRGDIVLDPFGGSGTTLIAAERCGRKARLIEYDAAYCDTIVRRYELLTGKRATLGAHGSDIETVADQRQICSQAA